MTDTPTNPARNLWIRIGTASLAGLAATLMALADGTASAGKAGPAASGYQLAQAGQGNEGDDMAADYNAGADEADFLTLLGLVEGHLRAGVELYRQGAAEMAKSHMKHPSDELYADLEPALAARGIEGFAGPLERLAVAVEGGAPIEEAEDAFAAVLLDIERTRSAATGGLAARLKSVATLVRTAAEEYEVGVKDGRIADPHEYQDAWGFVQAARAMMANLATPDRQHLGDTFGLITAELDRLDLAWPSVTPPDSVSTDAGLLYEGADRIEHAAGAVE